jgi:NADH-quinone oxidoreductase E subunit
MEQTISANSQTNRDVLSLLKEAQHKRGYISAEQMWEIAQGLEVPVGHIYGVATFYGFLSTHPAGRNIIRICRSVPCYLKESDSVAKTIKDTLGIKPGDTTEDGKFSLEWVNCLGACDHAPAMMVNDQVYGDLTPSSIADILGKYK